MSSSSTRDVHAHLLPEPELRVKVKKEKVDTAFRSFKGGTITRTINLDSNSPKKPTASSSDSVMPSSKHHRCSHHHSAF